MIKNESFESPITSHLLGINIHAGDYDSRTCLAVAFDNRNKNMMKLLKQYIDYNSGKLLQVLHSLISIALNTWKKGVISKFGLAKFS